MSDNQHPHDTFRTLASRLICEMAVDLGINIAIVRQFHKIRFIREETGWRVVELQVGNILPAFERLYPFEASA